MLRRLLVPTMATLLGALLCVESYRSRDIVVGEVSDGDVHRFVDGLHRLAPSDSACAALDAYLRGASRGLRAYDTKMGMDRRQLCAAIRRSPERYAAIEPKLPG